MNNKFDIITFASCFMVMLFVSYMLNEPKIRIVETEKNIRLLSEKNGPSQWMPSDPPTFYGKRMYLKDDKTYTIVVNKDTIKMYEGGEVKHTKLKYERELGQTRLYWCKGDGSRQWYCYIEP